MFSWIQIWTFFDFAPILYAKFDLPLFFIIERLCPMYVVHFKNYIKFRRFHLEELDVAPLFYVIL